MIRESFNTDWHVRKESDPSDSAVGPVTVPYDAMLFEQRDPHTPGGHNTGYFPGGVYRYTKTFMAPPEWQDRHVSLEFEGVYLRSEVFVNGRLAGGRPSGYATFQVSLDRLLKDGVDNVVEVVAHNNDQPNSRWYTGSGIYRPVHLLVGRRIRVTPDGLRIVTTSIDGDDATVEVSTEVTHDGTERATLTLTTELSSPTGVDIGPLVEQLFLEPGETRILRQLMSVPDAELWSPDTPRLYTATVSLAGIDQHIDQARAEFGIRTLSVDTHRGLRINGETVKLRGACIHHDNGVIGAHTLEAAEDRRIRILKASGYNAIRSAHNPASRATLRACDRHGVLVMDELTDVWWRPKSRFDYSREFEQWWERDLESLVAKNFNHPSVVMYAIGNEIAETATSKGIRLNRAIADRTRQLDPHRLVTNCINGFLNMISPGDSDKPTTDDSGREPNKNVIAVLNLLMGTLEKSLKYLVRLPRVDKRTRDAYSALDVAGYNYMSGRYRKDATLHPKRVIVGSETNPKDTAAIWSEIEALPQVIGEFSWTGWDYIGEAGIAVIQYDTRRQLYAPYPALLAGEPVIDITGHRQTQSYVNEIVWHLRSEPYLAVQPVDHAGHKQTSNAWRATNSIHSWSWEGCEGNPAVVEVYADADRVELLHNGTTLGSKPAGAQHSYLAEFTVAYQSGELTAVAYDASGTEIGRDTLTSARADLRLNIELDGTELHSDGADLAYLPISLTDSDGTVRPLADRDVTIDVSGAGTLLGFGSAEPITEEGFTAHRHRTYQGRALAVVRAGHDAGHITITANAEGCEAVTLGIPVH
ncbi:glycoside hydrolase family 2 TIM barrel-domain containing protein [soil metagenome]